jgi:hypothetical protein
MKRFFLTVAVGLIWSSSFGQDFHEEVAKVFNFFPHEMTGEEQKAVIPKLDDFFNMVMKNKSKYIEPLREELRRNDNNPYFYFDGGNLLLEISKRKEDIQLVADAFAKSDSRDIDGEMYLYHLLRLSLKGANVIDAALHILADTSFWAYIPQHALMLNYGEGLKFILPRYAPDLYIGQLISKFNSIPTEDKKITCLRLFVYANCCEADDFLYSLTTDSTQSEEIRNSVSETLKKTSVQKSNNKMKYAILFERRKRVLRRISDEALYEFYPLTWKMRKSFKCDKK